MQTTDRRQTTPRRNV